MPIRVATTGQTHGPELPNAIALLGKEKSFKSSSKSNWLTFSRFRNIISIPKT